MATRTSQQSAFVNGNFITLDDARPRARAAVAVDGRFALVGDTPAALAAVGAGSAVYDLRGAVVVPGFVDAHAHPASFGLGITDLDLSRSASVRDVLERIRSRAGDLMPGEWLPAHGYDQSLLAERRHPTLEELDAACPMNPLYVRHASGHLCLANSIALRMAGLDSQDPATCDGLGRDPGTGRPNGVLYGTAQALVRRLRLPHPRDELRRALAIAGSEMARRGVTSCHDAWHGRLAPWEIDAYREALEEGLLKARVCLMPAGAPGGHGFGPADSGGGSFRWDTGDDRAFDDRLKIGPPKFFVDGSITAGTAAFSGRSAYAVPAGVNRAEIRAMVAALERGHRVAAHAVGDVAVEAAVAAIERSSRARRGHRMEHCGMAGPGAIHRMARLGIVVVTQPSFVSEKGDVYAEVLGDDGARRLFPVRSLLAGGVTVAFGTDLPASAATPIQQIHDAVNRLTASGQSLGDDERISARQALWCLTVGGACASLEAHAKGRIREGMYADMTVLSDDPTRVSPGGIGDIEVIATVVGGMPVFSAPALGW
ncbi:MAG: amidohydrolase [Firmicutes bacterium]|jgi:predicted amidohydrolase YtcJ|nr:amidohydrolase [Bacillota bacterium]